MKKNVTRWAAGISSAVMLASFSALSVPAFAAEYDTMQAEAYVASFADEEAQTVARYFLDNDFSMEETEEMMGWYMDGQSIIESEQNAGNGIAMASVNTGKAFYSGTSKASTQHYGVIIIDDPEANMRGNMELVSMPDKNGKTYLHFANFVSGFTVLNNYSTAQVSSLDGESATYNVKTTTNTAGVPLAMCKFPIDSVSAFSNEAALYNAIGFTYSGMNTYAGGNGKSSTFEFHTYALGDFDHNGVVDNADYNYLMKFCILSFDGKFNYTDVAADAAYQVNILAADVHKDGVLTMQDAIALGKIING